MKELKSTDIKFIGSGIDMTGHYVILLIEMFFVDKLKSSNEISHSWERKEVRLGIKDYLNLQTEKVQEIFQSGENSGKTIIYQPPDSRPLS